MWVDGANTGKCRTFPMVFFDLVLLGDDYGGMVPIILFFINISCIFFLFGVY